MRREPGVSGKSAEAKHRLIKVVNLKTSCHGFIYVSYHLLKQFSVVAILNLNWRLSSSDTLKGDLKLLVDPSYESR